MLTLGKLSASTYVIVVPIADPAVGGVIERRIQDTASLVSCTAATNRISVENVTAWPTVNPCGAVNVISVVPVTAATVPPLKNTGVPPIAH